MNDRTMVFFNKLIGEQVWLACRECNRDTQHEIHASVEVVIYSVEEAQSYTEDEVDPSSLEEYQLVICKGCQRPSFHHQRYLPDGTVDPDDNGYWRFLSRDRASIIADDLYPSRVTGRVFLRNPQHLPTKVRHLYEETFKAVCSGQPVLSAIGIRALVEAVCMDHLATERSLDKNIDTLVQSGVLSRRQAEFLHQTRILGNAAAHDITAPDRNTLNLAMDIVEHLLTDTYVLPKEAEKLPKRKKDRSSSDSTPN